MKIHRTELHKNQIPQPISTYLVLHTVIAVINAAAKADIPPLNDFASVSAAAAFYHYINQIMSFSYSHATSSNNSSASADSSSSTRTTSSDDGVVQLVTPEHDTLSHFQSQTLRNYPPSDEDTISKLIDLESHHMPFSDYLHRCQQRSIDIIARQDSINWILKVHEYYNFSPVTAFLSVNYLDRFLSSHSLPLENGWAFQLLSVACLSLAAKFVEPEVPLLLDLQVLEPRFFFEPKIIQRMELRVMAILNWRLRSVTPFDYFHHFVFKLPSFSTLVPDSFDSLISASSDLILRTTPVIQFLRFTPSTMAAAAVFCAAGEGSQFPDDDTFHESVNKEMARSCHQLMKNYMIHTCSSTRLKNPRVEPSSAPPSPVGVLDAVACGTPR